MYYNTRLNAKKSKILWLGARLSPDPSHCGGGSPSPYSTPFGSYGASFFAPPAFMLGTFGLLSITLAHGEAEVRENSKPICSFEIGGVDAPVSVGQFTFVLSLLLLITDHDTFLLSHSYGNKLVNVCENWDTMSAALSVRENGYG